MKIAISVDSAADLSKELLDRYNITFVPFTVNLKDDSKLDGITVTGGDLLDYVDETGELPKTSAPSELTYQEHFETLIKDYDKVIHFCISKELSVAFNNAERASAQFNGNVAVVDSMSLSSGIALPALYACDLIDEGKEFDEIVEKCKECIPYVQASFTLDSLKLLHKGGRCSGTTRLISMALAIKPSMLMQEGKLVAHKKYMIRKFEAVVKKYVLDTLEEFNDYDPRRVFVTYTPTSTEVVELVKNLVKGKFEEVLECQAGATVSSHCGKNTIGILYINKKR